MYHADIHKKLDQAHKMLGLINDRFEDMEQTFQQMSRVKMDTNRLAEYLATVYPDSKEPDKLELVTRDRSWSEYFFDQGRGKPVARSVGDAVGGVQWRDGMAGSPQIASE